MRTILASGVQKLANARATLKAVHELDPLTGVYVKQRYERELVSNACFLSVFVALEEFFEASFLHYLTGRMSTARWRPTKHAKPSSVDHAHRMLVGTNRHVDWSTPDTVVKLADLYFSNGEPFKSPVQSVYSHLADMKTVRNSTAHVSLTTRTKLEAVYTRWTGVPSSSVSAYDMLLAPRAGGTDTFYAASESTVAVVMRDIAQKS